jgi:hypothetical protein
MKNHFKPFFGLLIVALIAVGGFIILNFLAEEVPAQEIKAEEKEQPRAISPNERQ